MDKENKEDKIWRTNRQNKIKPKLGRFYCVCDGNAVANWERCVVCGWRDSRWRLKKE